MSTTTKTKNVKYTQCKISKPSEKGRLTDVCWIPAKFAKKNQTIGIKQSDDTWDEGWVVDEVYSTKSVEEVTRSEYHRAKRAAVGDTKRLSDVK